MGGVPLEQGDGQTVGQSSQQHGTVAQQGEAALQAAAGEVNQQHPGEANQAAQYLAALQLLIVKKPGGDDDGKENMGGHNDRAFYAGGVGHTYIKQGVLHKGLHKPQTQRAAKGGAAGRKGGTPQRNAFQYQCQHTGQKKAQTGKDELPGRVGGGDGKQRIANFHGGKGTAPQKAAEGGQQADHKRTLQHGGGSIFHERCSF